MKNEKTGRAAGSAAGRVARAFAKIDGRHRVYICRGGAYTPVGVKAGDIKSAASSALTQRPDRPKAASTNPKRRTRRK